VQIPSGKIVANEIGSRCSLFLIYDWMRNLNWLSKSIVGGGNGTKFILFGSKPFKNNRTISLVVDLVSGNHQLPLMGGNDMRSKSLDLVKMLNHFLHCTGCDVLEIGGNVLGIDHNFGRSIGRTKLLLVGLLQVMR